jgi:hypothetical protein
VLCCHACACAPMPCCLVQCIPFNKVHPALEKLVKRL